MAEAPSPVNTLDPPVPVEAGHGAPRSAQRVATTTKATVEAGSLGRRTKTNAWWVGAGLMHEDLRVLVQARKEGDELGLFAALKARFDALLI